MEELPVNFQMEYRAVSYKHFPELQADVNQLRAANKIHNNEVFQSYIADFQYQNPNDFPEAKEKKRKKNYYGKDISFVSSFNIIIP